MATSTNPLIGFYKGTAGDYRGRYLTEILKWSDEVLEYKHDYIQTIFPLPEQSGMNWSAPIVDRHVFKAFREDDTLKENLQKAFLRIVSFYGLKLKKEGDNLKMSVGPNYPKQANNWVRKYDHNHLRITRIIRSLRVLGLEEEAQVFFQACMSIAKSSGSWGPSQQSQVFWENAATRPLNIVPGVKDQDMSEDMGPAFLREYEASKYRIAAPVKEKATADSELSEGQGSPERSYIANGRGIPVAPERLKRSNIAAISKESAPREPVTGKKQSRLDFFFKKAAKKASGNSPGDEIPGRMGSTSNGRTPTSGDICESLEHNKKDDVKDTAQEHALGSTQDDISAQSNSPIVSERRPGLKRKAGEEL